MMNVPKQLRQTSLLRFYGLRRGLKLTVDRYNTLEAELKLLLHLHGGALRFYRRATLYD